MQEEKTVDPLPFVREDELREAGRILGVAQVSFLGFSDGGLCQNNYHDLSHKIQNKIADIQPERIITMEPRGITGHLDHIALSYVVTYVFRHQEFADELWYACMPKAQREYASQLPEYFVYFPPGYRSAEVDTVVDVSSVWQEKISAARAHKSQKHDLEEFILPMLEHAEKEEYFIVEGRKSKVESAE